LLGILVLSLSLAHLNRYRWHIWLSLAHLKGKLQNAMQIEPTSGDSAGQPALPSILFVEDDRETQFLIKEMLEGTCEVVCAASAEEALSVLRERFSEEPPDLFLLDIRLPGRRSGTELLHLLRDFEPTREVPAVALTTYAGPENREALLEEGFDRHVGKPFRRTELTGAIDQALSGASPARE